MKISKILFPLIFVPSIFLLNCSSSDEPQIEETTLTANDFNKTIDENPNNGDSLGKIEVISNKDDIIFSIESQSSQNALKVDSRSGEISVNDISKFNFEVNEIIEGFIKVSTNNINKNINITINIRDLIEPTEYTFIDNSNSPFSNRYNHKSVIFKDKIWIIGGNVDNGVRTNDVLNSTDGINWEKIEVNSLIFSPRNNHEVVVFNDKIWVIGGRKGNEVYGDVWYSENGIDWFEETSSNFQEKVWSHDVVVFNNKMWLSGGEIDNRKSDRLWSSEDGVNWVEETSSNLSRITYHDLIIFNNKLWLIGGYNGSHLNEIWSSNDGVNWIQENTNGNIFSPRSSHQVISFQDKLWVIGGFNLDEKALNDIWSTDNGIDWTKENISVISNNFNRVFNHQSVVYKNKIWILGGQISNTGFGIGSTWHSN